MSAQKSCSRKDKSHVLDKDVDMRTRIAKGLASVGVVVAMITVYSYGQHTTPSKASSDYETLQELATQNRIAPHSDTLDQIASTLARTSSAAGLLAPTAVPPEVSANLTNILVEAQSMWLVDQDRHSIDTALLAKRINDELLLGDAPDFMQFRVDQLTRIRLKAWWQMPAFMVSSPQLSDLKAGMQIASEPMSPFEAFFVADSLLYHKLYNDDYLRTEEELSRLPLYPSEHRKPGLFQLPNSARRDAFRAHLMSVAQARWNETKDVLDSVRAVLEVSDVR